MIAFPAILIDISDLYGLEPRYGHTQRIYLSSTGTFYEGKAPEAKHAFRVLGKAPWTKQSFHFALKLLRNHARGFGRHLRSSDVPSSLALAREDSLQAFSNELQRLIKTSKSVSVSHRGRSQPITAEWRNKLASAFVPLSNSYINAGIDGRSSTVTLNMDGISLIANPDEVYFRYSDMLDPSLPCRIDHSGEFYCELAEPIVNWKINRPRPLITNPTIVIDSLREMWRQFKKNDHFTIQLCNHPCMQSKVAVYSTTQHAGLPEPLAFDLDPKKDLADPLTVTDRVNGRGVYLLVQHEGRSFVLTSSGYFGQLFVEGDRDWPRSAGIFVRLADDSRFLALLKSTKSSNGPQLLIPTVLFDSTISQAW